MPEYLNPGDVQAVRATEQPTYGRNASGYGSKIPTRHMLRIANRWHRVYLICYSNAATAYVVVNGRDVYLGPDTEDRIRKDADQ